jgi:hypothetical protein
MYGPVANISAPLAPPMAHLQHVRGARPQIPQTRPRIDLNQVDTGYQVHNLYVKIVPETESDEMSKKLTRQILLYITSRLALLKQMGLKVNVNRVRSKDLQNPALTGAMKRRGISRLPALTTPNNVYLGVKEIVDIYQKNTKEYEAFNRREEKTSYHEMDRPEDNLDQFYRDDMTEDNAKADAEDEAIGDQDTESMMRSYSRMMQRREKLNKDRKSYRPDENGGNGAPPARPKQAAGTSAPPRPAQSSRPDNVHQEGDDAEITGMIDRINTELRGSDVDTAFSKGGGDSLEDDGLDGAGSAQDKYMESMFWSNQEDSLR